MKKLLLFALAVSLLAFVPAVVLAQAVSGNISGTVVDKSGAAVPKASVTATNTATGFSKTLTATDAGEFLFVDLIPGAYNVTASAAGFAKTTVSNFPVVLNKTGNLQITLEVQTQAVTVEVTGAAPPINTTTPQIEGTFETRETADLPSASIGLGVINLSLLQPGVATSGGVGYGTGPSVGGQRPTNNNYTIEGVDNNDKSVTGPLVQVPNDAVAEFSALQNQYSPEFGHSNGGQFNQIIMSGTNNFHGKLYEYFNNRNLNAIDQEQIQAGLTGNPRYDFNRVGGQLGGPILKDKLFFFGNGEYDPLGQAGGSGGQICAPTAAGYTTLAGIAGINANNLTQLQQAAGAAPTAGNCTVGKHVDPMGNLLIVNPITGVQAAAIPIGRLTVPKPSFSNTYYLTTSGDYNMSSKDQFRVRYIYNRFTGIDTAAALPSFFLPLPARYHLVALNEYHTFSPNVTNELRLGYNRFSNAFSSGNFIFPGLDQYPNIDLRDLGAMNLGPDGNAPQSAVQNTYQIADNLSWAHKNHNIRMGVDFRRYIAPSTFTQRARGEYDYSTTDLYLFDVNPDRLAERSTGNLVYYGDDLDTSVYINDTWRIKPSFSLNFGMRYEYSTIPFGLRLQSINSAATAPGVLAYVEPRAPKNQFMPRAGFAWSPDKDHTWSIRGGISMGYDVNYDNLGLNSISTGTVPQLGATIDQDQGTVGLLTNYLASGAIPPGQGGFVVFNGCPPDSCPTGNPAPVGVEQQENTAGHVMENFVNPVAITWSLGIQHQFLKNYTAEVRYVGTHGYHLGVQSRLNRQPKISPTDFLPTFLTTPSVATLSALTTTLASINANSSFVPRFVSGCGNGPGGADASPCFIGANIVSFEPEGNSVYHGLSGQLTRRFEHGLQLNLAYTWSRTIDDSTATLFSTVITPRRPQDFQNVGADRSVSALNHTHRLTLVAYYDLPYFKTGNWVRRNVLGNWVFAPSYTYQSGEFGDVQSAIDANLNGDSAGDRTLLNSAGVGGTGASATRTCLIAGVVTVSSTCTTAQTVAYTATVNGVNSTAAQTARYIQAGSGALEANNGLVVSGRNTLLGRPINNIDFMIGKKLSITEKLHFEFQAQFLNLFNHPQFITGLLNRVDAFGYTGGSALNYLTPGTAQFNQPQLVFASNSRQIQLVAKLVF